MTISKDRVKPSPLPDSWKLSEIFATGVILGGYLAMMTVIFFWAAYKTDFFPVCSFIFPRQFKPSKVLNIHIFALSDEIQANDRYSSYVFAKS